MFGRNEIVKVIKKGDLDRLKVMLEENPVLVEKTFRWRKGSTLYRRAAILHIAASCDQPEITKFLVTEKGMAIDKTYYNWSPLYYAADGGASQSVKALLDLGANRSIGDDPYKACKNETIKQIFNDALEERGRQKELARQEEERRKSEAAQREAAARIEGGRWESGSPDKITLEHDMSGHRFRLTEEFDFAAECWTQVTKDLRDGQISPMVKKSFSAMSDKGMIAEARTQLEKIRGDAAAKTPLRLRLT